jgi:hypothetical protein
MSRIAQYTLRGVPPRTDAALRRLAKQTGASLNEVAVSLLNQAADPESANAPRHHDLDGLSGSWTADPRFDEALAVFEEIDPKLWK